ncbi:hypothetical protein M747DRAFT_302008 [Aspergillus niger ATCC 13496]|uniref:Uncharacterized protein n=3 Tax=Aspergillus niger TaxID=5061 RepID=A2R1N1_ASPNC|nr:hypothetical protein An13g01820 [Aspergillus niger]RDH24277.1 hypothetical protein M747DRAFT_302008 [Aspergillus niger ATCC 13496]CAK41581.1 hypothetical protein An13g01820 [Aspergillus niger]
MATRTIGLSLNPELAKRERAEHATSIELRGPLMLTGTRETPTTTTTSPWPVGRAKANEAVLARPVVLVVLHLKRATISSIYGVTNSRRFYSLAPQGIRESNRILSTVALCPFSWNGNRRMSESRTYSEDYTRPEAVKQVKAMILLVSNSLTSSLLKDKVKKGQIMIG